ncbi:sensor histidine kinase [Vallitalea okinawensis]|uniref:sensor histidine kinase n=1 Tax=Vallitalea okinawensis TaxID=2078660 RepID=UPI000CFC9D00|nr:sensor histidine kinase [Vallitalea okinawensis]
MSIMKFIKQHLYRLLFDGLILSLMDSVLATSVPLSQSLKDIMYLNLVIMFTILMRETILFRRWKNSYDQLHHQLQENDVHNNVPILGQSVEEDLIRKIHRYHVAKSDLKVLEIKDKMDEINDYITKWTHEIKMPITVLELIACEVENFSTDKAKELRIEIDRLRYLVGQVLHISRANSLSEDLSYQEVHLDTLIKEVIKSNMNLFIHSNMEIRLGDLNHEVLTDTKWLTYICEQLFNNACKYGKENGWIEINSFKNEEKIYLSIRDNGLGIPIQDIERVWDKGFTGENGRKGNRSTGMGLYLVHKIANQLGHEVSIESEVHKGTCITIEFSQLVDLHVTKMSL